ncbi:hypothetical protein [Rugosimonospora africana]|uniref:Uncharacterized protein n=1 Tax=Rugosimonospora africana TaxID=556532 RepID=A0A8J3QMM4_9ACTN|nr:hypothetical protein [Rugosimonospora africana]GIH12485.1 hypothetical protein Raf01_06570 [Rugosimonospora africana]
MSGRQDRLERHYRRLLLAYPAAYRVERGDEIVGTYLEAAGSDQRLPSVADATDVLRGGMRQHLRANRAAGLAAGASVAATFALTAAVVLAAVWLAYIELPPAPSWLVTRQVSPFWSLGAVVWIAWLGAGLAALALPARLTRWVVLAALAATVAAEPVAALSGYDRPPLLVLVPQLALGMLALGWPTRPTWTSRMAPAIAGTAALLFTVRIGGAGHYYRGIDSEVLAVGAIVLLAGSLLLAGFSRALHGDNRGLWAVLLLLLPIGLLAIDPLAGVVSEVTGQAGPYGNQPNEWPMLAGVTVVVTILATGAVPLVIGLRARLIRQRPGLCPTCGKSRT